MLTCRKAQCAVGWWSIGVSYFHAKAYILVCSVHRAFIPEEQTVELEHSQQPSNSLTSCSRATDSTEHLHPHCRQYTMTSHHKLLSAVYQGKIHRGDLAEPAFRWSSISAEKQTKSPDQVIKFQPMFLAPHYHCFDGSKPLTGLEQNKFIEPFTESSREKTEMVPTLHTGEYIRPYTVSSLNLVQTRGHDQKGWR